MGLSNRFLVSLAAATALLAGTPFVPELLAIGFAIVGILCAAAALDGVLLRHDLQVDAERSAPPRLSIGVPNYVRVTVRLRARGPRRLRVADTVPAGFPAEGADASAVVRPGIPHVFTYLLRPTRRGPFSFGDIFCRVRGPLGLAEHDFRVPARAPAPVYPDVLSIRRALLGWRTGRRAARRRFRPRGRGDRFESLRAYRQGDPPSDVYWKGTARFGDLLVKEFSAQRNQNLVLALDMGRLSAARIRGLSRLDHAANAALLAAFAGLENGDRVGLLAFDSDVRAFLPPAAGLSHLRRVLRFLQPLEPTRNEPDYARAIEYLAARLRRRTMLVLFTDVFGTEAAAALEAGAHRALGNHLLLVATMKDPDVEKAAAASSRDVASTFRKAAAVSMLDRQRRLLGSIASRGIHVADVPAESLATEVLNRYLRAKQRSIL